MKGEAKHPHLSGLETWLALSQNYFDQNSFLVAGWIRLNRQNLAVEIERTDNLFARIFFEDIRKMSKQPGMTSDELRGILSLAGLNHVVIVAKSGLLYGLARND